VYHDCALCYIGIIIGLTLLLSVPLTVSLTYRTKEELTVKAGVPPVMLTLYPTLEARLEDESLSPEQKRKLMRKIKAKEEKSRLKAEKKKKRGEKKKESPKKAESTAEKDPKPRKKKSPERNIRFMARLILLILRKFTARATVRLKRFHIVVATKDAAETAYLYGTLSAATAYLLAVLDANTKKEPSRKNVSVYADFTRDSMLFDLHVIISLRLSGAIAIALSALWHLLSPQKEPSDSKKRLEPLKEEARKG